VSSSSIRQGLQPQDIHKGYNLMWAHTGYNHHVILSSSSHHIGYNHMDEPSWATTTREGGPQPIISQPHGLQPKGRWAPTQYSYIPTTWATTQGSLGTNLVQLYLNHMGYNPRIIEHQPNTTYQSIDKCHTQLIPSRSIITGQPSSIHRGARPGECLMKLQPSTLPLNERGILYHSKFITEVLEL
jgi:hypothetical protein